MSKPFGICTDEYYLIMKQCWNRNADERPTFTRLYHIFSNYFDEIERDKKEFQIKNRPFANKKLNFIRNLITIRGKKKYRVNKTN